jgi:serine/threonine protein kinase
MGDLLRTLDGYHRHGVIHKDVKPDNVIVTEEGVRVVDLGLLTPLTSALTLTTHGTEYFRDPEMVKLAVQGKRVKDVHAVRFDIYSSGAVLYYLLEGSFPACGPLSRFSRPVPMVLSWIVSRAMAEGEKRYPSVAAMRADLEAVTGMLGNGGLDDVAVSRLPSFSGFKKAPEVEPPPPPMHPEVLTPVAPARSVKPLPVKARRTRRESFGCWGFLLLFAAFMVGVMYLTMSSPAPERSAELTADHADTGEPRITFSAQNLAEQVLAFREELGSRLPPRSVGDLSDVPILFVTSDLGVDEVVRDASRLLSERGVTIHPSTELADAVKDVLTPQVTPADVQRVLVEKLGTDTLPVVVQVSWEPGIGIGRGYGTEWPDYRVRVYYLTLFREAGMFEGVQR